MYTIQLFWSEVCKYNQAQRSYALNIHFHYGVHQIILNTLWRPSRRYIVNTFDTHVLFNTLRETFNLYMWTDHKSEHWMLMLFTRQHLCRFHLASKECVNTSESAHWGAACFEEAELLDQFMGEVLTACFFRVRRTLDCEVIAKLFTGHFFRKSTRLHITEYC